jgi:hypothetical protein
LPERELAAVGQGCQTVTDFQAIGAILPGSHSAGARRVQSISHRTDQTPSDQPENTNFKPIAEIEGALADFVRRDVKSSNPKDTGDVVTNVGSLLQRAMTLGDLQNLIQELDQLHDFLHSEGQRLEQEISEYAQLSKSTTTSSRLIADNMLHWKKSDGRKS